MMPSRTSAALCIMHPIIRIPVRKLHRCICLSGILDLRVSRQTLNETLLSVTSHDLEVSIKVDGVLVVEW